MSEPLSGGELMLHVQCKPEFMGPILSVEIQLNPLKAALDPFNVPQCFSVDGWMG